MAEKTNNVSRESAGVVIGIDVGGSTTKIVGFRHKDGQPKMLIPPMFVRATDPITSIYGALGRFTSENGLALSDINRIMMTGVGSSFLSGSIYDLDCRDVPEFSGVGLGGLYLSGLDEAIIVSMGTGTALVHAKHTDSGRTRIKYLGGTGIGGGTLMGLTKKMLGVDKVEDVEKLCEGGDLSKIDLKISDLSRGNQFPDVNTDLTASNFGNLSGLAENHDLALGIANMVAETIAMISIFAARGNGIKNIVLTGNLTTITPIRKVFKSLEQNFGVNFIIPENAQFATVIGAALYSGDIDE